MPPIEQSLRGTLLTGASALALSVTGYSAEAQVAQTPITQPQWTVWVEGDLFATGGTGMNVPSLPGLTAPFTTVGPKNGLGGAAGFDDNYAGPYHVIFDFFYGRSRTASASTQSSFHASHVSFSHFFSTTINSSQTDWEKESHLVADLMIGRDFGLGNTTGEIQFGIRVADLTAKAWAQQSSTTTFTSEYLFTLAADPSTTTSSSAVGSWRSRFFGFGPRAAVTGTVPLWLAWSADYEAGVAGLFGTRSFDYTVTLSPGATFSSSSIANVFVFNADAWAGLSYALTPHAKVTGGIRVDYYADPLTTYNSLTGGLTNIDRAYWGPFLRLTGKF